MTVGDRPWVMRMRWLDLLFAHWPLPVEVVQGTLPAALEVDTYAGSAWVGAVPFEMAGVAPRGLPAVPRLSRFPELNLRTYVTCQGRPGIWFYALDAASWVTVEGARRWFHLPYLHASMSIQRDGEEIDYRSERTDDRGPGATFRARYAPTGPVEIAAPGSLDDWLTARWRLFAMRPDGSVERTEIRHRPWPLQPARVTLDAQAIAAASGLPLVGEPTHVRYSAALDVRAWWPRPA